MSLLKAFSIKIKGLVENPVLLKDLRIGLREKKLIGSLAVYMLVLGLVAFFYILELSNRHGSPDSGRDLFMALILTQWFLVVFIAPSLTSVSLSSEREKKTFDMLITTLLSASDIIAGKIAYAVSLIFLLLSSSLPLVAIVFFLGGVSPVEIAVNYIALMLWGVLISTMALYFSSREQRSANATSHAYGIIIIGLVFFASFYIPHFLQSGHLMGFGDTFEEMVVWSVIYFNVAWMFSFFFCKIAGNLKPLAKYVLTIHYFFIIGFAINIAGLIIGMSSIGYNYSLGSLSRENMSFIWTFFTAVSIVGMGCFIERNRFPSSKEEAKIEKAVTSKPWFFPGYFISLALLISMALGYLEPAEAASNWSSFVVFILFIFVIIQMTKDLFLLFSAKIRPIFIYFGTAFAISVLPVFTWLASGVLNVGSVSTPPLFSMIFLSPIFVQIGIWDAGSNMADISLGGMTISSVSAAFASYVILVILLRILTIIVTSARNSGVTAEKQNA